MKPLLVGELNPYGDDDYYALYPLPKHASGHRLCVKVMGIEMSDYLERFDRINLCYQKWSTPLARARAAKLVAERQGGTFVLFGKKACTAFGVEFVPFTSQIFMVEHKIVMIPHPSGLNRIWNLPNAFQRARQTLVDAGLLSQTTAIA